MNAAPTDRMVPSQPNPSGPAGMENAAGDPPGIDGWKVKVKARALPWTRSRRSLENPFVQAGRPGDARPHPSIFNAARNAVCGISTFPN